MSLKYICSKIFLCSSCAATCFRENSHRAALHACLWHALKHWFIVFPQLPQEFLLTFCISLYMSSTPKILWFFRIVTSEMSHQSLSELQTEEALRLSLLFCAGCHCCCAAHCSPCVSLGLSLQPPPQHLHQYLVVGKASWTWLPTRQSSTTEKIWMIYTFICHLIHNYPLIIIQKSSGLHLHPLFSVDAKSRVAEHLSARKLPLKMWVMHKDYCVFIASPV